MIPVSNTFFPPSRHLAVRLISAVTLGAALTACGTSDRTDAAPPPPPTVSTLVVQASPQTLQIDLPGRIAAVRTAEVRARVSGIVLKRRFEEGTQVKAGQVLFEIDPARMRAALSRARGALARVDADIYQTRALVDRYEPLVAQKAVSQMDYDNAVAALKNAEAARVSALADIETARLDLDYATVRAPISGRIGRALITEGALVGEGEATPMARIHQLDPIYADFQQSIDEVLKMRAALAKGTMARDAAGQPKVSIALESAGLQQDGKLLSTEAVVDPTSGQVSLRGQFRNADSVLLPGMYVRVRLDTGVDPRAIFVPQRAIQRGADGISKVLVVDGGGIVQERAVATGVMRGADWQIVEGVNDGDRIVIERGERLAPGTKVIPQDSQPSKPLSS